MSRLRGVGSCDYGRGVGPRSGTVTCFWAMIFAFFVFFLVFPIIILKTIEVFFIPKEKKTACLGDSESH